MNSGTIIIGLLVVFIVFLAATNRLDKVWKVITGQQ